MARRESGPGFETCGGVVTAITTGCSEGSELGMIGGLS
jgi:hypothetical protein